MKRLLLLCLFTMLLAACATSGSKDPVSPILDTTHQPADAESHGVGDQENFKESENNSDQESRFVAPHNQTMHFAFDNSVIQEEDKQVLTVQANYLLAHPNATILLAGHTDEVGSREYNIALGERRAKSVLQFMRFAGVKPGQIRLVSYGQEKPVAQGHNQEAYKINRRVELTYEVA